MEIGECMLVSGAGVCDNTKMEVKYINAILNELVLKDLLIEMNNQVYSLNI